MEKTLANQTIALAGLAQATELVKQVARSGRCDEAPLSACMRSLLMVDAQDILDVYGGLEGLRLGLEVLDRQLSDASSVDPLTARYASTLIYLEPKLAERKEMGLRILGAIREAEEFRGSMTWPLDPRLFDVFAAAYQDTVSHLRPQVMVAGEQRILSNPQNAAMIRTLLLAGVRAALLWRQAGGSRWRILFLRGRHRRIVRQMLDVSA